MEVIIRHCIILTVIMKRPKSRPIDIAKATQEVEEGKSSLRAVAKKYDMPTSTLHDHVTGKVEGTKPGPPPDCEELIG